MDKRDWAVKKSPPTFAYDKALYSVIDADGVYMVPCGENKTQAELIARNHNESVRRADMSGKETWLSVDVETSGAVPGIYDLVSIGACVIGDTGTAFYAEVKPHGGLLDPEAMAVHKLTTERLLKHGGDPKKIVEAFCQWVKIAANGRHPVFCSWGTFDWMWMGYYLEKYGRRYTYPFGPNSLDLKSYYLGLTSGTEWRACTKRRMPEDDLRGGHTHNALDDAVEQAEMVEWWTEKYRPAL